MLTTPPDEPDPTTSRRSRRPSRRGRRRRADSERRISREHHRSGQAVGVVRIEAAGQGERDGGALGEHERGQRACAVGATAEPARAASSSTVGVDGADRPHQRLVRARALMGPWRYSMAGYASAHAPAASRSLSAASSARPTVQPAPRNTNRRSRRDRRAAAAVERQLGRIRLVARRDAERWPAAAPAPWWQTGSGRPTARRRTPERDHGVRPRRSPASRPPR